jgi:hypothetical protein
MGRYALLTAALLGAGSCTVADDGQPPSAAHADLACAECHAGGSSDVGMASVPTSTCARSDCHRTDNPARVALSTVEFEHRSHGSTGEVALGCAGCHAHASGSDDLVADLGSCALCHRDELLGERPRDCERCHVGDHDATTSQGVTVPHEGLSWTGGDCVRCHYDVSEPESDVSIRRCATCHIDVREVTRAALGEDVHPDHSGVPCVRCHTDSGHRIVAMSSAVTLDCSSCHDQAIGRSPTDHAAVQRLFLGLIDSEFDAVPSDKFMDGLTCTSCHIAGAGSGEAAPAPAAACVSCHRPEYGTVLAWWKEGVDERLRLTRRYVRGAVRRVEPATRSDSVAGLLTSAEDLLTQVEEGGGVHNLLLSHRMLEAALRRASSAYEAAGRRPPEPPRLGPEPRRGLCGYCHYRLEEIEFSSAMDPEFHRRALR